MNNIDDRDLRIIATVACPYCGAATGLHCVLASGTVRGMPHAERTAAWRARGGTAMAAYRDNRERKIVDTVSCPYCEVGPGSPCVRSPGSLIVTPPHPERRERWQEVRPEPEPANAPTPCRTCGHGASKHGNRGCTNCDCAKTREEARR
jgi:hypothetical protein